MVVVGASSGAGRAIAMAWAGTGGQVIATGRDEDRLAALQKALGDRVQTVAHDVTAADAFAFLSDVKCPVRAAVYAASHRYVPARLHQASAAEIERSLSTDLLGAERFAQAVLPRLMAEDRSALLLLGSLSSTVGMKGGSAHAAAKAGLEALARNIALEYGQYGVRCNVIRPGVIDGTRFDARTADSDARREKLIAQTVTGELVTEQDVADLALFLLSEKARAITGSVVDITAGAHLNRVW